MSGIDPSGPAAQPPGLERLARDFEQVLERLESARAFAKVMYQSRLFPAALKLLRVSGGVAVLYRSAPRFEAAGVFAGGDWDQPDRLQPALVRSTLLSGGVNLPVECLSELRFLAIACGEAEPGAVGPDQARDFLDQVLALNLDLCFPEATEVTRERGHIIEYIQGLFQFIIERLGMAGVMEDLVAECERLMLQRSIMFRRVENMLRAAAHALPADRVISAGDVGERAKWMIESLEGPTPLSHLAEPEAYRAALSDLDADRLAEEAQALGRRMEDTGLVSPQHATLLRLLSETHPELLPSALALDRVGRTSLAEHPELIHGIIERAVEPRTAHCIYGLSRLLNRGILFFRPVSPGLQHLMVLPILPAVADRLKEACLTEEPPEANTLLLAGTLSVLGQPRGVDQGHNPTCQAARAISLWSQNDVGYLLDLIARAARDDDIVMHFEGNTIRSSELTFGLASELHPELDAVSLLLTPHLDKIYMEMSRRTIGRGEDGHKWVNPEFHGWWVHRGFASLIHPETGGIREFDSFMRRFYAAYHPDYNGGQELIYAQPCGVVSTTSQGEFVGWHAVSIQRVAPDPGGRWRVYFFNPNRDKGQDWGRGIVTSTADQGELEGESSLPFEQFAMRLYVFHYRLRELGDPDAVPDSVIAEIRAGVAEGWAASHLWE